jgi:hypothetical protein
VGFVEVVVVGMCVECVVCTLVTAVMRVMREVVRTSYKGEDENRVRVCE